MRRYEKIKIFFMGVITTLLVFILISASNQKNKITATSITADEIITKRLVIQNEKGERRAMLYEFGGGCLSLYDSKGDERIVLSALLLGADCLAIYGKDKSKPVLSMGEFLGMPYIQMNNEKGEEVWNAPYHNKIIAKEFILADELYRERAIWYVKNNEPKLLFRDENQNGRMLLSITKGIPGLVINDENMKSRIMMFCDKNGTPSLNFLNEEQEAVLVLTADNTKGPGIFFFNEKGKFSLIIDNKGVDHRD